MRQRHIFGYGSLVNRRTHDYDDAAPARLPGWRREWRHTASRAVAYLTAVPDPETEIDGLLARVAPHHWDDLDHRERAYDRVQARAVHHPLPHDPEVQVYTIPHGKHAAPDAAHPVLLSYVDTVVQGFLNEFGEDGVARFFATTLGWDAPVADDRQAPIYTRAQALPPSERALVDRHLDALACQRVAPPPL